MPSSGKLKGFAFEWFVRSVLKACGFNIIKPDGNIIYNGPQGVMIHGLGQPHNADVLMAPPFQIPFYFPSRILIECKCYDEEIGLPIIRGAHGLREDINGFEVVTPELLAKRRNYRRKDKALYDYDRYQYQVAVASSCGFKMTAQEYATTHRIPLISFGQSDIYSHIRNYLNVMGRYEAELVKEEKQVIERFFRNSTQEFLPDQYTIYENERFKFFSDFIQETLHTIENTYVGVLENGTLVFLYLAYGGNRINSLRNRCTIYWQDEYSCWSIREGYRNSGWEFLFELPSKIYELWAEQSFGKDIALNIKEQYFKKIFVFGNKTQYNELDFFILELSPEFIKNARQQLNSDEII